MKKIVFYIIGFFVFIIVAGESGLDQEAKKQEAVRHIQPVSSNWVETAKPKPADPAILRGSLKADYEQYVSNNNRHLNFIKTDLTQSKKGFELWAIHEYFNEYSLSIGDNGKEIPQWIVKNMDRIKQAGIIKVGLKSADRNARSWIDIKK